ncbi:D-3-phosphoglycerate dehydrogenase [Lipingzhangella halophila]|uniref:D-3-phosphoglycerate dehydrogenase n=1 Tax=Lipingzhangella halophila TaxID=1783352 RepID=A0A7W7RJT6_9ACTN|nr:NAD(P)-dependent oxidoreductase [Lipingzhangella halophila]MBB4932801.1 D-3-phosphoglycerate dehydrogenase [Lipingzhangella halophila]
MRSEPLRLAVAPDADEAIVEMVRQAGAVVVDLADAQALAWTAWTDLASFPRSLPAGIEWVQLPSAGVERWVAAGIIDRARVWTSAVGVCATPVAEHALTLLLAGVRLLPESLRSTEWARTDLLPRVGTLAGTVVGIVGGGSIARALIPALAALGAEAWVVNRGGRPVPGAVETRPIAEIGDFWEAVDHVVVAAPQTSDTRHLVGSAELDAMKQTAWLINVARGPIVDTEALVRALDSASIAGAGLDVTDPEPLPASHPLWGNPRVIVTPHVADAAMTLRGFHQRLTGNVRRWMAGEELVGVVDLDRGY